MRGGVTRQEWSGIVAFYIKLKLHTCKGQVQTVILKEGIGRLLIAVKDAVKNARCQVLDDKPLIHVAKVKNKPPWSCL